MQRGTCVNRQISELECKLKKLKTENAELANEKVADEARNANLEARILVLEGENINMRKTLEEWKEKEDGELDPKLEVIKEELKREWAEVVKEEVEAKQSG